MSSNEEPIGTLMTDPNSSGEEYDVTEYFVDEEGKLRGNRRKADKVLVRLNAVEKKQQIFSTQLEINTSLTQKVSKDTADILELLNGVKSVIKGFIILSKFSKWIFTTVIALYGLYLLLWGKITSTEIFDTLKP